MKKNDFLFLNDNKSKFSHLIIKTCYGKIFNLS